MDDIEEEKRERLTVERRQKNLVRLFRWSREVTYSSWIDKGSMILSCVKRRLLIKNRDMFLKIHEEVGKNFVLCGSWPAQAVTEVINMMNNTMEGETVLIGYEALRLLANDVDVYVGNQGCAYKRLDGLDIDINIIECLNLSHLSLLHGNDINITDVAICVKKDDGNINIDLAVGGSFWKVLLERKEMRRLGPSSGSHLEAKSFVRLAYKSFQMKIPVDWEAITCEEGLLAKSHVRKIEEMKTWSESPLKKYKVKYIRGSPYLKSMHGFVICRTVECSTRGNKQCPFALCKSCCMKKIDRNSCKVHK